MCVREITSVPYCSCHGCAHVWIELEEDPPSPYSLHMYQQTIPETASSWWLCLCVAIIVLLICVLLL